MSRPRRAGKLKGDRTQRVFDAFRHGVDAKAGHLSTDGTYLYSYAMAIGARRGPGNYEVIARRHIPTVTTHAHVSALRQAVGYDAPTVDAFLIDPCPTCGQHHRQADTSLCKLHQTVRDGAAFRARVEGAGLRAVHCRYEPMLAATATPHQKGAMDVDPQAESIADAITLRLWVAPWVEVILAAPIAAKLKRRGLVRASRDLLFVAAIEATITGRCEHDFAATILPWLVSRDAYKEITPDRSCDHGKVEG